jgi:hypothetical protein
MHSRYLKWLIGITITCVGLIAAINYIVDPAWIYHAVEIPGFNQVKPKVSKYRFIWKATHLEFDKPEIVFLGNSRIELGFDPDAAHRLGLVPEDKTVFNTAIPGLLMHGFKRFVQQVIYTGGTKELYIGIDFSLFQKGMLVKSRELYTEHEGVFVVDPDGNPQPFHSLVIISKTLFSSTTLNSSIQTLKKQKPKYQSLTKLGFNSNENMLQEIFEKGTQKKYFLTEDIRFIDGAVKNNKGSVDYVDGIEDLREILTLAKQHNIKTTLFTSPTHVHLQYLDAHAGDGDTFYNWKRALVKMVNEVNRDAQQPIVLWDFTIPTPDTMEELPQDDHGIMQWYLDPSHYRSTMGERMMRRFMGGEPAAGDENFGMLLTADTVEENIRQHRQQLLVWEQSHPDDYAAFMARMDKRKKLLAH